MKILYGIQLTGNGHINRSMKIISKLRSLGHDVEIMTSGGCSDIEFDSLYTYSGFTFQYKNGSIDWIKTMLRSRVLRFMKDIFDKNRNWDLVISDFEPVSAWKAKVFKIKSISISNQNTPILLRTRGGLSKFFMRFFCPTDFRLGFDYTSSKNVYFPIIDDGIVNKKDTGRVVVYLPYLNQKEVFETLNLTGLEFVLFTNSNLESNNLIEVSKISKISFQNNLSDCSGVITHCGFSTTSEALILGKKLWAIPIKSQWEQKLNSLKLKKLGIYTGDLSVNNFNNWQKHRPIDYRWIDPCGDIIKKIIEIYEKS